MGRRVGVVLIFIFALSFLYSEQARKERAQEASRWGFEQVKEDFFTGEEKIRESWEWGEDLEQIKLFFSSMWSGIAEAWRRMWEGMHIEEHFYSEEHEYEYIVSYLNQLAWDYYQEKKLQKAEEIWKKVLAIDPDNQEAIWGLAEIEKR
ncbi:MAG: hypothetical protein DRP75_01185 [Candidatus Omnitrophota bacterium]|nr:MAG: hypothetical protein DRP75_01185 [Candidatus Omnitrophota bacterium]